MSIPGTTAVSAKIAPTDSSDVYPTHDDQYGLGGYRSVASTAVRDAISAERRKEGMLVFTIADQKYWRLGAGLANANWVSVDLAAFGQIERISRNGTRTVYTPSASTDASRAVALRAALLGAVNDDVIRMVQCRAAVLSGVPLSSSLPAGVTGVKLLIEQGSALLYATPADASADTALFEMPRNVLWFGADRTAVVSSSNAFLTARLSLPWLNGLSVSEGSPGQAGGDIPLRAGEVEVPDGVYLLTAPFYMQGWQTWRGLNTGASIYFANGLAPEAGGKVYAFGVLRSKNDAGAYEANFTHNANVYNFLFAAGPTGNEKLCFCYWAGAQISRFQNIHTDGFQGGVHVADLTDFTQFEDTNFVRLGGRYPAWEMNAVNGNGFKNISVNGHNVLGAYTYSDGKLVPAVVVSNSQENSIWNLNLETCVRGIILYRVRGMQMAGIAHGNPLSNPSVPGTSHPDAITLEVHESDAVDAFSIRSRNTVSIVTTIAGNIIPGTNNNSDHVFTNWSSNRNISGVTMVYPAPITFTRANRHFVINSGNDDSNPSLGIYSVAIPGGAVTTYLNLANANGGPYSGYNVIMPNIYVEGPVRATSYITASAAGDPTVADIPDKAFQVWTNTTTGETKVWSNVGGVLKSTLMS